jgi:hypothetical protein
VGAFAQKPTVSSKGSDRAHQSKPETLILSLKDCFAPSIMWKNLIGVGLIETTTGQDFRAKPYISIQMPPLVNNAILIHYRKSIEIVMIWIHPISTSDKILPKKLRKAKDYLPEHLKDNEEIAILELSRYISNAGLGRRLPFL